MCASGIRGLWTGDGFALGSGRCPRRHQRIWRTEGDRTSGLSPFGSVCSDLQPRGLDIDTAKLLADKLGVKLALTPVNRQTMHSSLLARSTW